ncbi:hypothetical protein HanIR_Chr11g0552381 [Helianthus annuus]|nr:hypothetical protein HanIR_Chr11g0552381 [Helianthus annuus]
MIKTYRDPPKSWLASFCRTSISIMAASRYLFIERTLRLLQALSFRCPNTPKLARKYLSRVH